MVKTKQTACGGNSSRPVGMQEAMFGDETEEGQFKEIPEEDWPELDAPRQGEEVGESSKSKGKEGDQPTPQAKAQAEGGATAPPADDPTTAVTVPPQDPTDKPRDPQAGPSADDPGLKEYVGSYMQAAQDWFDSVQNDQVEAYKELYDTLLQIGKPHIKGLEKADGNAVLASIADKSGQFISEVDKYTVYVSKD